MIRLKWITIGALLLGVTGFHPWFFRPHHLRPSSQPGPLLGIFITGPLSFLLGGPLGAILGPRLKERFTKRLK